MNTPKATKKRGKSRYLILGFSIGAAVNGEPDPPPLVVCTTGLSSSRILSVVDLPDQKECGFKHVGRWRLAIEVDSNDLVTARRILSGFEALLTHVYHGRIDDLSLEPLPPTALSGRRIQLDRLISGAEHRAHRAGDYFSERSAKSRIRSFFEIPDINHAFVLFQLPVVLRSESFFSACTFFHSCCADYAFVGDSIGNVLQRREKTADLERDRQNLERLVLNSFRVIEAIVGEPGKDRERFRRRMADRGLDFDESVGFRGTRKKRLGEEIYRLQELRDSTSAHGIRRRKRPVSWFEAMTAQHLAESVLHQALWQECSRMGRPEGTEEELAYLLKLMYPMSAESGWVDRTFAELGGKTPIQASREPGGPEKVQKLAEALPKLAHDSLFTDR